MKIIYRKDKYNCNNVEQKEIKLQIGFKINKLQQKRFAEKRGLYLIKQKDLIGIYNLLNMVKFLQKELINLLFGLVNKLNHHKIAIKILTH